MLEKTSERVVPDYYKSVAEYLIYLRHLFAYQFGVREIPENSYVLEIGCGEGYGTSLLSKHVDKIVALDVDENTVKHAMLKYKTDNCNYKLYDGYTLPFDINIFDAVISYQVIEHVDDDYNFISEIFRVLKERGIFLVSTPNRTWRLKPGQKPWNKYHVREYCNDDFRTLLQKKFDNVQILGIKGTDEINKLDKLRFSHINEQHFLYREMKRIIPTPLKTLIKKMVNNDSSRRLYCNASSHELKNSFTTNDFQVISGNIEKSIDLIGKCIR
jgi:ubiquinone/menaquinone biosynthesis C-methylase UbiE